MEMTVRRTIPASPAEVYDAWLDPKHPGNPWHDSDTRIFEPRVDALYYFVHVTETWRRPHFGRFLVLDRPNKIQQTLMSLSSLGLESVLTVSLAPRCIYLSGKTRERIGAGWTLAAFPGLVAVRRFALFLRWQVNDPGLTKPRLWRGFASPGRAASPTSHY